MHGVLELVLPVLVELARALRHGALQLLALGGHVLLERVHLAEVGGVEVVLAGLDLAVKGSALGREVSRVV